MKFIFVAGLFFGIASWTPVQSQSGSSVQLEAFEIKADQINYYDLNKQTPFASGQAPYRFEHRSELPSGFDFASSGVLAWYPTPSEFDMLEKKTISIDIVAFSTSDYDSVHTTLKLTPFQKAETADRKNTVSDRPDPVASTSAQSDSVAYEPLKIVVPDFKGWNKTTEGKAFSFKLKSSGGEGKHTFSSYAENDLEYELDPDGYFNWVPAYTFVSGDSDMRGATFHFVVRDEGGNRDSTKVELLVENENRAPIVNELPTFYVQYDKENQFELQLEGIVYDEDGDALAFKPVMSDLPQGMTISREGLVSWKPSIRQFNALREEPMEVRFIVEDIPYGEQTSGILRIEVTQQDLPPQITMVPDNEKITIKENESLNLSFFINDPNGRENIATFDFVSQAGDVTKSSLKQVGPMQYEFKWIPDYAFVAKKDEKVDFDITFFTIDMENNRAEQKLKVTVEDAVNVEEQDRLLYFQYRTVLVKAFELVEQLEDKEEELKKEYKRAKNGKKNRAITNASLGVVTGLSPVFLEGQTQKVTVGIGGTATATIGSLEASNVIGNPPSDVMQKWSYVTSKKNEILLHGNIFAGTYAQKEDRRKSSFQNDLKNLTLKMNLKDMTKLELDANWQSTVEASDKNIKKVFQDFYPDERYPVDY